jgi:thioesterase domain-containing protein
MRGKLRVVISRQTQGGHELRTAAETGMTAEPRSLWSEYQERMFVHVPGQFRGRVTLFRSSYLDKRSPGDDSAGWSTRAAGVEVHRVPGDHQSCVTTHVAELAARMRPYLPG